MSNTCIDSASTLRRLYRRIQATAGLERYTPFLALSTGVHAFLHLSRHVSFVMQKFLGHLVPLLTGPYQHFGVFLK
jgi:hypothetical protein